MPNYCENLVNISHPDPKMIQEVLEANNESCLFQRFVPFPEELIEGGWYDWCIENWGTKWDQCNTSEAEIDDPNQIELCFDTAWSPPVEFYKKMKELGFTVEAYYYEPGCQFCGSYKDGDEEFIDIEGDSEWARENIPEEINEVFDVVSNMEYWESEEE
nr:MAG: hypothetical protein [Caudoviricetes sp.]